MRAVLALAACAALHVSQVSQSSERTAPMTVRLVTLDPGHFHAALVQKSMQAAMQVERRDPRASIEVLDLRSLAPYDWAAIRASRSGLYMSMPCSAL